MVDASGKPASDGDQPEDSVSVFNSLFDSPKEDLDENETLEHQAETESAASVDEPVQQQSEAAPQPSETNAAEQEDDPLTGLSEAQRARFLELQHLNNKLQNDVKANSGRVSALNRKLEELTKAQQAAAQKQPSSEDDILNLKDKSFQEVESDYPEIANYVRAQVKAAVTFTKKQMERELTPLKSGYETFTQQQQHAQVQSELDRLAAAHPDYAVVSQSPEFAQWLSTKPQSIQALGNSMLADDNIELLNLFKGSRPAQPSAAKPAVKPNRSLSEHVELPRKGAGQPQTLPDDPVEYFNLITS